MSEVLELNLNELLHNFIEDPENSDNNFKLGIYYDSIGQTASAVSYYLRTAERTDFDEIKYQAILRAAICFDIQGCRNFTVKGLLQHALAIMPKRPEAYFLLSRFYEREENYQDCYLIASLGENIADRECEPLKLYVDYPGFYGILFEKAVSSWWCGLCDESRKLFVDLKENYELDEIHLEAVNNNLNRLSETSQNLHEVYKVAKDNLKVFDWGKAAENEWFKDVIEKEIFTDKIYEKYFQVKEGDIVVDIGANVGAFSYSIKDKKPKHIYCLEPSNNLVETIKNNLKDTPCTVINRAVASIDSDSVELKNDDYIYCYDESTMKTIRFKTFIDQYNIDKINFLKIDCEGGEYEVFTEENCKFILENVDYIVGEWHFTGIDNFLEKFSTFRELYLKNHTDYKVFERCGKDITDKIFDDEYLIGFEKWFRESETGQLLIYIDNTSQRHRNSFSINENIDQKVWVIDNFYSDPNEVRDFALKQDYVEGGFGRGFIGRRTEKQFLFEGLKEKFELIMGKNISKWEEHGMNGRFQIAWSGEPLVYHCDSQKWGGMLYLTPDAPYSCGTTLYANKTTRARTYYEEGWDAAWKDVPGDCHLDGTHFEPVDVLGNVFNRLVIFDASSIHSASQYFGTVKENGSCWQMFFFDTSNHF